MGNVTTIGLDLAKSVFQVHGIDADGAAVLRQRLTRGRVLKFFAKLPPCLIGIEAGASSHYRARELIALGHEVKLTPAQYVKPYVTRHWDPYPFIPLNLALSFQAAYAAPFVMMSQNRQGAIDRRKLEEDCRINIKAELEIEHLYQKIDEMREREILSLSRAVRTLSETLTQIEARQGQRAFR